MKRKVALLLTSAALVCALTGCSSAEQTDSSYSNLQKKYNAVCSQLDAARTEIQDLKTEVSSLNSQITQYEEQMKEEQSLEEDNSAMRVNSNTVLFDDLEIIFSSENAYVTKLENQFSEYNGHTVIAIPISVKNCSDEVQGLNPFYIKYFGSQGVVLRGIESFFDDGYDIYADLRPGASTTGTFYMLYDGAGTYYVSFENFGEKKEIAIEVKLT